jgi:beta-lactamase superfamily II metal-dependent hydrolase
MREQSIQRMSRTAAVLMLWLFASQLSAQQLEIRFLDVGQGDATLIREGGKTVLIDAGAAAIASTSAPPMSTPSTWL